MTHFLLETAYDTNRLCAYGLLAAIIVASVPPFRRVWLAVWRYVQNDTPRWARRLLAACVAFPGFWDEIAAFAIILAYVLASRRRRAELSACIYAAWKN